jgi:serine/threonine protein kinase
MLAIMVDINGFVCNCQGEFYVFSRVPRSAMAYSMASDAPLGMIIQVVSKVGGMNELNDNMHRTQLINATESQISAARTRAHDYLCNKFNSFLLDLDVLPVKRDFQVRHRLGRGRQGVVFKVIADGFLGCQTQHAVKIFDPSLFTENRQYDAEMLRIARQVSVLQQIYHPNLVQCDSFHEHDNFGILVMELVDGINLRDLFDRTIHNALETRINRIEWKHFDEVIFDSEQHSIRFGVAIYMVRKMLRGLGVLHRTGYIHSDIKPSNVMIDRFGTIKLIDFGRATKIVDPGDQFLASPMYMAPELHERQMITRQADIYSCGMVLLEILHGGHVIDMYAQERDIHAFKLGLPDAVGDFLPKRLRKNKELIKLLRKLLAVDLEGRYPTAEDADTGTDGASVIHKQLMKADLHLDYGVELETYMSHRIPKSQVISRRRLQK